MKLKQKRIRGINKLLSDIPIDESFLLGTTITQDLEKILSTKLGLNELKKGTLVFPSPQHGIMSERNAVGEYIPQMDKPKETAYRAQEWELKDWRGYGHSGTSYVSYKRYPRKFIEPKELKLKVEELENDNLLIVINKVFKNQEKEYDEIIFGANLFL